MSHERESRPGERYTSDLTDAEWALIAPMLPLRRQGPGRPLKLSLRDVIDAIFYLVRTGCRWEVLPRSDPDHNSVYYHYRKWIQDDRWRRLNAVLSRCERIRQGRQAEPGESVVCIASVRTLLRRLATTA